LLSVKLISWLQIYDRISNKKMIHHWKSYPWLEWLVRMATQSTSSQSIWQQPIQASHSYTTKLANINTALHSAQTHKHKHTQTDHCWKGWAVEWWLRSDLCACKCLQSSDLRSKSNTRTRTL